MLSQRICSFPVNSNLEGTEILIVRLSSLLSISLYFVDKLWNIDAVSYLH